MLRSFLCSFKKTINQNNENEIENTLPFTPKNQGEILNGGPFVIERTYENYSKHSERGHGAYYYHVIKAFRAARKHQKTLDFKTFDDAFLRQYTNLPPNAELAYTSDQVFDEEYAAENLEARELREYTNAGEALTPFEVSIKAGKPENVKPYKLFVNEFYEHQR
jgi:hypothetical protein